MRIIRYRNNNQMNVGLIKDGITVVGLPYKIDDRPYTVIELVEMDPLEREGLFLTALKNQGSQIFVKDVTILSPIAFPKRNVFCLGKNYIEHAKELEGKTANLSGIPEYPIYFSKTASPTIGPGDTILLHEDITFGHVDYEVELGIIIGKEGVNIALDEVEDYIFGYTIINDVSARALQVRHTQWFRGKCLDTHCPMGPVVVTKDEIPFPITLDLTCKVNDEIRQQGNTRDMIFDIPTIISDLSRGTRLYPGDIIATGTPSGVGMGFDPPKYLKSGDIVMCEIEQIGSLVNTVK